MTFELKMQKAFGSIIDQEKIIRMDGSTKRHNRTKMTKVPLPSIPYIDYLFGCDASIFFFGYSISKVMCSINYLICDALV